jgi:TatD DNase family protein
MFIDTHCHLDLPPLVTDLPRVLQRAAAAGVTGFICPGVAPADWQGIAKLTASNSAIQPAYGIHPLQVDANSCQLLEQLATQLGRAVAVGEIGLDYYHGDANRLLQQQLFRKQLQLAREFSLPVIIHCRKAFADTLAIFREESGGKLRGVMHAFSGSAETASEASRLGLLIGVAGSVTWEGAVKPQKMLKAVSLDRIVLETDAPDLAPQKHRGVANEPAFIVEVACKTAEIKGVSVEEVARITSINAQRLFNV